MRADPPLFPCTSLLSAIFEVIKDQKKIAIYILQFERKNSNEILKNFLSDANAFDFSLDGRDKGIVWRHGK